MDFEESKSRFLDLFQSITCDVHKLQLLHWLRDDMIPELDTNIMSNARYSPASIQIEKIAADIRKKLPLDAIMKSENIVYPTIGDDSNLYVCDRKLAFPTAK